MFKVHMKYMLRILRDWLIVFIYAWDNLICIYILEIFKWMKIIMLQVQCHKILKEAVLKLKKMLMSFCQG